MIYDIDINKTVVPNKVPFSKEDSKYFIGYRYAKKIRPLCQLCPEMCIYRSDFEINLYIIKGI